MVDQEENLESNSISMVRHKIVFVGDVAVGKTSIIYRFIENRFLENYEPSIGMDFCTRPLKFRGKNLRIQIWDSAGQEKYKSLVKGYVRSSSIVFVVFDVSRNDTFENVLEWINYIKSIENPLIVLCGNKIDTDREVDSSEAERLAEKEGLLYFEVSAKTNENIKKMFYTAVSELPFFDPYIGKNSNKIKIINELEECNNETKFNNIDDKTPGILPEPQKKTTKQECKC